MSEETWKKIAEERERQLKEQRQTINDLYDKLGKQERLFSQFQSLWMNGDKKASLINE